MTPGTGAVLTRHSDAPVALLLPRETFLLTDWGRHRRQQPEEYSAAAVLLRGHVEPLARTAPMHSARSREGAAACTAAVPR